MDQSETQILLVTSIPTYMDFYTQNHMMEQDIHPALLAEKRFSGKRVSMASME